MNDRQILRFVTPKRNDWYTQRSWLPDESSPLAIWDTTVDEIDSSTDDDDDDDDSNDYDCSDISCDGISDYSMTDSYGTSSEDGDRNSANEDITSDDIDRLRKWAERRRSERGSAPEPDDQYKPNDPTASAMDSIQINEPNKTTTEPDPSSPWYDPHAIEWFAEEWDRDPRNYAEDEDREKQKSLPQSSSNRAPQRPEPAPQDTPKPRNQRLAILARKFNPPPPLSPSQKHTSTATSVSDAPPAAAVVPDNKQQHSEVENPGQRELDLSIRLFAKEQSRVSRDAVRATGVLF